MITLGLFLKSQGFFVWQNNHPQLGGDAGHEGKLYSWHLKCGGMGALDVNFDTGNEPAALDALRGPVEKLGFNVIWREKDHFDHMHIDPSTSAVGGGGFAGPLDDVLLDVRLVDWDAELGGPRAARRLRDVRQLRRAAGPGDRAADLRAVRALRREDPARGVRGGDRRVRHPQPATTATRSRTACSSSSGPRAGARWSRRMDPVYATRKFLQVARSMDRPGLSAGALAANVQRPREDLRGLYAQREGQARALIGEHC